MIVMMMIKKKIKINFHLKYLKIKNNHKSINKKNKNKIKKKNEFIISLSFII
jgi:hypothetical protein